MVNSRDKGRRAENQAKDLLRRLTGLKWERTPMSGALSANHKLKGDLYIPNTKNTFCVEVKHYKDDHLTSKILTSKNPQLFTWWAQTLREAEQTGLEPLLLFKFDRSKWFVATKHEPTEISNYIYVNKYVFYIMLLEEWVKKEEPIFTI